jgi:pyrroline-5-carboxylate reductase
MEIGFIGWGRMGASMACRLLRGGLRVADWNRTARLSERQTNYPSPQKFAASLSIDRGSAFVAPYFLSNSCSSPELTIKPGEYPCPNAA